MNAPVEEVRNGDGDGDRHSQVRWLFRKGIYDKPRHNGSGRSSFYFSGGKIDMILSMQCRFGIEFDDLGSSWMCMIFVAMFTPITCDDPVFWRNPTEIIVNSGCLDYTVSC